jgi:glucose/arabinose dehydrogenase
MKNIFICFILLFCLNNLNAQGQVNLKQFSSGYTSPLDIENCGDSRLFIVQQTGQIMICDSAGHKRNKPFLDISDSVLFNGGELGLLGCTFDPGYATNGFVYVQYINKSGNIKISRFKRSSINPNIARASSEKLILEITKPPFVSHNGGCIHFGPDGYLYIGLGDGGGAGDPYNLAQDPMSLLGKMLRIDVHNGNPYAIPANNPFVDSANYKKEIWAMGMRNPWRWSFDAVTGAMMIADVGQDAWEEIDRQPPGKGGQNYGWRCYEGRHAYNTSGCKPKSFYTLPIYEYAHSDSTGDCSVTGGFIYRGNKYQSWYGKYFFADYCSGIIKKLTLNVQPVVEEDVYNGDDYSYTSFGEDHNHELYITNINTGIIYHLEPAASQQSIENKSISSLQVMPNPSHGSIMITCMADKVQPVTIVVQNLPGQIFYQQKQITVAGKNTWHINLPVVAGMYYVVVTAAGGDILYKQIKME